MTKGWRRWGKRRENEREGEGKERKEGTERKLESFNYFKST